jgi:F420-dependent oxidoreductase-like protein
MRFSVWPSPQHPWSETLEVATYAAETGWDGVYFPDHFMPNGPDVSQPVLECWTVLAALAVAVPRVRLGALVTGNTYRHPAVLANMAAAVDQISEGRLVLGLGAGWQENEHAAYGIELPPVPERLARFEEACHVVRSLLSEERVNFQGRFYQLTDAPCEPKGFEGRQIPLLVGGSGEKVTLRIAAQYADEWNAWGTPDVLRHLGDVLDRHCQALERDPDSIAHSAQALVFLSKDEEWLKSKRQPNMDRVLVGTPAELAEEMGRYVDAGVDEFIVPDFNLGHGTRRRDTLDLFMAEVAAGYRDPSSSG